MSMFCLTRRRLSTQSRHRVRARSLPLSIEALETRCVPAGFYMQTNLVSDIAGMAPKIDPNLKNPWGIVASSSGPFWVSDNATGLSTLYNGSGTPQSLVVTIPPPTGGTPPAAPDGIVFNSTTGFTVTEGTKTGASAFIFTTEDGTISGWSPSVDSTNAILAVDHSTSGAVYKGLALDSTAAGNFLLATNFNAGKIDVFNQNFAPAQLQGSFTDPNLPAGYAPFNVAIINNKVFVTYALQDSAKHDDVAGPGNGYIDVYDTNGNFLSRFASQGALNSPWGLALAPSNFGTFSNDLLVGNFGDGHITAFDPNTGAMLGQMTNASGQPIVIDGLWGLSFGNGGQSGPTNSLYFTAGPNDEADGLFGDLTAGTAVSHFFAVGADAGGGPEVKVYNASTNALIYDFFAYSTSFTGGVRVAVGDVNGDGIPDIITVPGPGGGPEVNIYDGSTGNLMRQFFAFNPAFIGGSYVAAGDVTGSGFDDIIVGADAGGGPNVTVFSGKDNSVVLNFFAYNPAFVGGVRVAAGDVDVDGKAEIITGPGAGGGPQVTVFKDSGSGVAVLTSFFAYNPAFNAGIYVGAGDLTGSGLADVVVGAGAGGGPNVTAFNGETGAQLASFFAYDPSFTGGVRVAAVNPVSGSPGNIVTAPGPGGGPLVEVFGSPNNTLLDQFFAFSPSFGGGLFVGAN
jgi:uncharacterized protein (TIGR03118 family)